MEKIIEERITAIESLLMAVIAALPGETRQKAIAEYAANCEASKAAGLSLPIPDQRLEAISMHMERLLSEMRALHQQAAADAPSQQPGEAPPATFQRSVR